MLTFATLLGAKVSASQQQQQASAEQPLKTHGSQSQVRWPDVLSFSVCRLRRSRRRLFCVAHRPYKYYYTHTHTHSFSVLYTRGTGLLISHLRSSVAHVHVTTVVGLPHATAGIRQEAITGQAPTSPASQMRQALWRRRCFGCVRACVCVPVCGKKVRLCCA